jgi:hypothetical protein
MEKWGERHQQVWNDLRKTRRYWKWKEEILDRILCSTAVWWHKLRYDDTNCGMMTQTAVWWHELQYDDTNCGVTRTAVWWHKLRYDDTNCGMTQTAVWHKLRYDDTNCGMNSKCVWYDCHNQQLLPYLNKINRLTCNGSTALNSMRETGNEVWKINHLIVKLQN